MQRSQCLVGFYWVPLGSRLPTLRDGVDGRSGEGKEEGEEEEEESPKELESEEEEMDMAVEGLGFLRYWLWEEEGVRCEDEPIRGKIK